MSEVLSRGEKMSNFEVVQNLEYLMSVKQFSNVEYGLVICLEFKYIFSRKNRSVLLNFNIEIDVSFFKGHNGRMDVNRRERK